MKIAIATDNDFVSAHFGRCASYTIVEITDGKVMSQKLIENPEHSPGFLPGFLAEKGVECIIAGGMGPRAQNLFAQKNIQTIVGVTGNINDVIEKFLSGAIEVGESLCDRDEHHGHGNCGHE